MVAIKFLKELLGLTPVIPGYNPALVREHQLAEGFRLLDADEIRPREQTVFIQRWDQKLKAWHPRSAGSLPGQSYATALSKEQLAEFDTIAQIRRIF